MSIRLAEVSDWPQLRAIFAEVYRHNPLLQSRAYFDWQFRDSPFHDGDGYTFWLAEDDQGIQGFLGFVPIEFRDSGEIRRGGWTQNWYASRQDGTGLKLLNRLFETFDHRFMVGLSADSQHIYRRYRIPLLQAMPRYIAILDPRRAFACFGIEDLADRTRLGAAHRVLTNLGPGSGIGHGGRFPPGEEFFFAEHAHVRRTGAFLNWRYLDIPKHDYHVLRGESGFAIYRIETVMGAEERVVRLLEWGFGGSEQIAAMGQLVQLALREGAILMDYFCTGGTARDGMAELGFVPETELEHPIPYLFRPVMQADGISLAIDVPPHRRQKVFSFEDWYITKGDADVDRVKL